MFARRKLLYKHSLNGAHPHLAARATTSLGQEKAVLTTSADCGYPLHHSYLYVSDYALS